MALATERTTTARTADVLVIGGGIQGCATALELARRSRRVILVDKNHIGRHASGVNAGGVRSLLRHEAEIPLSLRSMEMWRGLRNSLDADFGFKIVGQVAVAETEPELTRLRERAERLHALGYRHEELLDRAALREMLPALAPHCAGGLTVRSDGFASPYHTTMAFRTAALRAGVKIIEECRATAFRRQGGIWRVATSAGLIEAAQLVNCAGAWAGQLAAELGETVPLEPIAPMMMVTGRMSHFVTPVVLGAGRKLSFKQAENGTVLIGGGHRGVPDTARNTSSVDFGKLAVSARTAADLFPVMAGATITRCWSGIESRLPDDIPVIGPSATEEAAFHAFGFSAHGFQLGPVIGEIMAQLVETGRTQMPIKPFAITRFAKTVPAAAPELHG